MAAIYGMIDWDILRDKSETNVLSSKQKEALSNRMTQYRVDRIHSKEQAGIFLACAHQHITPLSASDTLPYMDQEQNVYLTADCMLDNRAQLINLLSQDYPVHAKSPDGQLIYYAYLKWHEACASHLEGAFAFTIYDRKEEKLLIYADQVYERNIYYAVHGNRTYFSTLMKPIMIMSGRSYEMNPEYVGDTLGAYGFRTSILPDYTPIYGIYKVRMGHYIKSTPKGSELIAYYNPEQPISNFPYYRDEQWKEAGNAFREVLYTSTREIVQGSLVVGSGLSAGLDSTTISGMAARILKEQGKKLKTFTYIPTEAFKADEDNHRDIIDESIGAKIMTKLHDNLESYYNDNGGDDALMIADHYVDLVEAPMKYIANMPSVMKTMAMAKEHGVTVMLFAQYGNLTISSGKMKNAVYHYVKHGKWHQASEVINGFHRRYGFSRRQFIPKLLWEMGQYQLRIFFTSHRNVSLEGTYVKRDYARNTGTLKRLADSGINLKMAFYSDLEMMRAYMYEANPMMHMGEINTKWGLIHGMVIRDPSKKLKVIEACRRLPMAAFVHNGYERHLIRGFMGDLVPPEILYEQYRRGVQSEDYIYMLKKRWDEVIGILKSAAYSNRISEYVDRKKIEGFFNEVENSNELKSGYKLDPILHLATLESFIRQFVG